MVYGQFKKVTETGQHVIAMDAMETVLGMTYTNSVT